MDKKEEELKRLLEEDLKRKMEGTEFNNSKEDMDVSKEEQEKSIYEEKDKKKNTIIIALVVCVVILLVALLLFLISGKSNSKDNDTKENETKQDNKEENQNQNQNVENNEGNDNVGKLIKEEDFDYSKAKVYFNKYIAVVSNDEKRLDITDLDGTIIMEVTPSYGLYEGSNNVLYIVDLANKGNSSFSVKTIKDNISNNLFTGDVTGLLLENVKNGLAGVYKESSNGDIVYLFNNNNYDKIELESNITYSNNSTKEKNKYIYNGRYFITYDNKSDKYGLYDVKENKVIIKNSYEEIKYLHDSIFSATSNGNVGVIDKDNKVLLKIDNDSVNYSNGLYFIGNSGVLQVYDKNLKNLNTKINVSNLNNVELIPFYENVVLKINSNNSNLANYIVVDKNGKETNLGSGNIGFAGIFLIKSNDNDNFINMYDSSMTLKHKIDVGSKAINLDSCHIFLNNTLAINRRNIYNLSNDSSKGTTSWYRRTSQEYDVRIDFSGEYGTVTVSSNDEVLKVIKNVSVDEFLRASNNGITITKNYFIYNAGGVVVLKRTSPSISSLLDFINFGSFEGSD